MCVCMHNNKMKIVYQTTRQYFNTTSRITSDTKRFRKLFNTYKHMLVENLVSS